MAEVIDEAVRREQALQLERIRLAARKAGHASEISSAAATAWKRLDVPYDTITQIRKILSDIVLSVLKATRGQIIQPDLLSALGTVRDSLSGSPAPALPSATRTLLLATLGPEAHGTKTAAAVRDLYSAGLKVAPADLIPPFRCLADAEPALSDVPILQSRLNQEWRLFADAALVALGHAPLEPNHLTPLLGNPKGLVDPAESGFHRWFAFLHAYELTLRHDLGSALEQVRLFETPPYLMAPIEKEVVNLRAYLMLLTSGDAKLGDAISLLDPISRSPTARKNRELLRVRQATTRNQRDRIENPYLALGVNHGAPRDEWRAAWMGIKSARRNDVDALSQVNAARDQILELEKDESNGLGRVYVIPLDTRFLVRLPESGESNSARLTASLDVIHVAALRELLKSTD